MKIRTTEMLIDFLNNQLAWRKKELSLILSIITSSKTSDSLREALIRSGIPILYAHWEGFVKIAATHYIEFIVRQGLTYAELSTNFIALAIKKQLLNMSESSSVKDMNNVADFFINQLSTRYSTPWLGAINTKSNLSSEVLADIIESIGGDFNAFKTRRKFLDTILLDSRNNIAHGQYLSIDKEEYINMHSEVITMIDTFNNQIQNAAVMKMYKK